MSVETEWDQNGTTDKTEITFEELPHDTIFQFRVRAWTSVGYGPFSNLIFAKTEAKQESNSKCFLFIINDKLISEKRNNVC